MIILQISEQLKQETRLPHAELEKLMVGRIRSTNSPASYLELLRIFYGFYQPVEACIDKFVDRNYLEDYPGRRKSSSIVSDMEKLGGRYTGPVCRDLPVIENAAQAFGALYVLEGSTLGGRIISQMIEKNMANEPSPPLSFFNGYGEAAGVMWSKFKEKLNAFADDAGDQDGIVAAATDTFVKFKNWMTKND